MRFPIYTVLTHHHNVDVFLIVIGLSCNAVSQYSQLCHFCINMDPTPTPTPSDGSRSVLFLSNLRKTQASLKRLKEKIESKFQKDLRSELLKLAGVESFRVGVDGIDWQYDLLKSVVVGCDVMCLAPMGSGKGLCINALSKIRKGITIVIVPLTAIANEMVDRAKANQLPAHIITDQIDPT